jgi:hypothetical protein
MHTIFSSGLTTNNYAMGSSEPLSTPTVAPSPEDVETQESSMAVLDGTPEKLVDAPEKGSSGKRKRGAFANDEIVTFTHMTSAGKNVARAIRDNKPTDMHPDIYQEVTDSVGFSGESFMAALGHLIDHKA